MASDPVAEGIAAREAWAKIARRAERARKAKAAKEEEERIEAERIANLPPPPILPKRLEFKFPKKAQGLKPMSKGNRIEAPSAEPGTVLVAVACLNEEYTIEDFPEGADDIPGTFEMPPPLIDVENVDTGPLEPEDSELHSQEDEEQEPEEEEKEEDEDKD